MPLKDLQARKEYNRMYRKTHRELRKKWAESYRERHKEYDKKYRKNNVERKHKYDKDYYKNNKKRILKRNKIYFINNKEKINQNNRNWYQLNKEKVKKYVRKYNYNKYIIDINYRIRCNLRHRIWGALKYNYKSISTMILIGCSLKKLKQHLKSQFLEGMSWNNYGKWHVDHIRPCASFDLSKPKEQKKCFNYTNLQPLWAKDNLRKKDKYDR